MYASVQISPKYQKWSYLRQRKHKLMQLKVSCWSICSTVHRYVLGTGHLYDLYTIIFGGIMTDNNKSRYWTKRPKWGRCHIRHYLYNIYALFCFILLVYKIIWHLQLHCGMTSHILYINRIYKMQPTELWKQTMYFVII